LKPKLTVAFQPTVACLISSDVILQADLFEPARRHRRCQKL